jgi:hypothetical protein
MQCLENTGQDSKLLTDSDTLSVCLVFETGSPYVARAGIELSVTLLNFPSATYRHVPPSLLTQSILFVSLFFNSYFFWWYWV